MMLTQHASGVLKSTVLIQLILMAGILGVITPLGASTFVAMTPEELIRESDVVIQGTVIHLESSWDEEGRIIVTDATIQVSDAIVGEAPSLIVVRTPGGTVAGYQVEAQGFPELSLDEEVILFIKNDESIRANRIVGHQQGHFEVVERLDGVRLAVPRIEDEVSFFTPSGRVLPRPPSSELDAFRSRLRAEAVRIGRPVN